MGRNILAAAVVALASMFSVEAEEKSLKVEFKVGDFFALSDGSVWEFVEAKEFDAGQNVHVKGNYRKEWQTRIRSNKSPMKAYTMSLVDDAAASFQSRLIGISDLQEKVIATIALPAYDLSMLELFTEDVSDEMGHLIELDDGTLFSSLSPPEGDVSEFQKGDHLVTVRFDLRNHFLINLQRSGAGIALKIGKLTPQSQVGMINGLTESKIDLREHGIWTRISDLPYFPWHLGEQVQIRYFDKVYASTRPGDLIHIHNRHEYVLLINTKLGEVVMAHKNHYVRMPPEHMKS